jgi:hypothetical protein
MNYFSKPRAVWCALLLTAATAGVGCAAGEDEKEPGHSCFVAGTLVATPGGPRPIESLAAGDEVWAFDVNTMRRARRRVEALHRASAREVRSVRAGDLFVRGVTPSHPVYAPARGAFVPLRELRVGDAVLGFDGEAATPRAVEGVDARERPAADVDVYNLTVEGPEHTYFADGLLVHNKLPPPCAPFAPREVNRPAEPLPRGTTSYAVRADYGDPAAVRPTSLRAEVERTNVDLRAPPVGPPQVGPFTSDDGGRTWSFQISDLEPGARYVVRVYAAPQSCPDGATVSFEFTLESDP